MASLSRRILVFALVLISAIIILFGINYLATATFFKIVLFLSITILGSSFYILFKNEIFSILGVKHIIEKNILSIPMVSSALKKYYLENFGKHVSYEHINIVEPILKGGFRDPYSRGLIYFDDGNYEHVKVPLFRGINCINDGLFNRELNRPLIYDKKEDEQFSPNIVPDPFESLKELTTEQRESVIESVKVKKAEKEIKKLESEGDEEEEKSKKKKKEED